jgi:hypothetical protein
MGTAEEHVYSAWQGKQHRRRRDERATTHRDRFASPEVYLLRAVREWKELSEHLESGPVAPICEEVEAE